MLLKEVTLAVSIDQFKYFRGDLAKQLATEVQDRPAGLGAYGFFSQCFGLWVG